MTGSPDDPIDREAVRRNTRRLLVLVAGLTLVAGVGGVLAGVLVSAGEPAGRPPRHPALEVVLLVATPLLVLAGSFLVLRLLMRRSSFQAVMQFGWSERRAAYKAVKAGRPLADREIQVARGTLAYLEERWMLWIWPALIALFVLNGLTQHGPLRWLMLALAVTYVVLWPFGVRQRRRVIARYRDALSRGESSASV